jgi:hypothetical protein
MGGAVTEEFLRQVLEREGLALPGEDLEALAPTVGELWAMFERLDELDLTKAGLDVVPVFQE